MNSKENLAHELQQLQLRVSEHESNILNFSDDIENYTNEEKEEIKKLEKLKNKFENIKKEFPDFNLETYKQYKKYIIAEYHLKCQEEKVNRLIKRIKSHQEMIEKNETLLEERKIAIYELEAKLRSLNDSLNA